MTLTAHTGCYVSRDICGFTTVAENQDEMKRVCEANYDRLSSEGLDRPLLTSLS